ncbi:hypothetical protein GJT94_02255 (plasmid) [Enterobacteriaceae endosymbiont of Donacia cinerea]|uniref:prephenate dehydratase domain-containing protein n=1 Tax=Enterobacteriaceae endosymbiont of Donacia cinerea TaxID=2675774 RepID=UPI0014499244|nr:prephenate dehydratase domain-containing protein [Enterobacteriaceae endosymbiont of Donacia cinerea]QJC34328.1 hypothetical protein GJT94_02255 [Enterobacteriaceae endosymbiont of Donacia cinerea]
MLKIIKDSIFSNKNNNTIINYNIENFIKKKIQKNFIKKYYKSIAFLGPRGSYSHLALLTYTNNSFINKTIISISCKSFTEIFFYIKSKIINFAIIPIYNNYTGLIKEVLILLKNNKYFLHIKKKIILPIQHCLVSHQDDIYKIKKVFSHPEPFKQCSIFINKFPKWEIKYCSSSSFAMKFINKNKSKKLAAIGNKISAKFYKLKIIKTNISNKINNQTSFLVLEKR